MDRIWSLGGRHCIRIEFSLLFILNFFRIFLDCFSIESKHFQCVEIAFRPSAFAGVVVLMFWMGSDDWYSSHILPIIYTLFHILCHWDALARAVGSSKAVSHSDVQIGKLKKEGFLLLLFEWHMTCSMFAFKLARIIQLWLLISEGLITLTKVNQTLILNKIATASITCRTFIIFLFPCERMHCFHYASLIF